MSSLTSDSARRLNELFDFLCRRLEPAGHSIPAYVFIARIVEILGNREDCDAILPLLIQYDSITLRQRDPLRPAICRLIDAGILQRSGENGNQSRTFSIAPQYQNACRYLRDEPSRFPNAR